MPYFTNRAITPLPVVGGPTTWDSANKTSDMTLSSGDLTAASDGTNTHGQVRSTNAHSSGKYYIEFLLDAWTLGATNQGMGVIGSTFSLGSAFAGGDTNSLCCFSAAGGIYYNGSEQSRIAQFTVSGTPTILMLAIDLDNNKFWARKLDNVTMSDWNASSGTGNPATNTLGVDISGMASSKYIVFDAENVAAQWTARFASASWTQTPPSGFGVW